MQETKGYAIIQQLSWIFWSPSYPATTQKTEFFIILFNITTAFKIVIQQLDNPTNKTLQNKRFQLKKISEQNQWAHKELNHLSSWLKNTSPELRQIQYHHPTNKWAVWFTRQVKESKTWNATILTLPCEIGGRTIRQRNLNTWLMTQVTLVLISSWEGTQLLWLQFTVTVWNITVSSCGYFISLYCQNKDHLASHPFRSSSSSS